jgi:NTP pyrophosphatase (non-canonical NTP hydrolase)
MDNPITEARSLMHESAMARLDERPFRVDPKLASDINRFANVCYQASKAGGWHNDPKTGLPRTSEENDALVPTRLMLTVSEVSEAMEAHRSDKMDDKLPHRTGLEVELADAIIRIGDLARCLNLDLGGAVVEKIEYNLRRADHTHAARNAKGGKKY